VTLRDTTSPEGALQRTTRSAGASATVDQGRPTLLAESVCSYCLPVEYHGHRGWADFHKGTGCTLVARCSDELTFLTELGLLCADTRKSACECSAVAATGLQSWSEHRRLSLFAHGPRQSSRLLFVECLGSSAVSAVPNIHVASDQTCQAHADASSSLLPPLAI
jgi:hypothetical protein